MEGDSGELFAATKGAIMAFTRSLALSLAPTVRVNALAPGWIKTDWGEGGLSGLARPSDQRDPDGRWGTPEDVAAVARFLVSPAPAFLTGQVVRVNGGRGAVMPASRSGFDHRDAPGSTMADRPRYLVRDRPAGRIRAAAGAG